MKCLLLLQVLLPVILADKAWNQKCPTGCTCHESHFSELPLYRFLQEKSTEDVPLHFHNNVMYDDEPLTIAENRIMKMAICIFQSGSEPYTILSMLSDIQALTILQGRDSEEIVLEAQHLSNFQQLEVLEVHGFYHEASNHSHNELPIIPAEGDTSKLMLRNDALRPLLSLKYLNLQNVRLLGNPEHENLASPAGILPPLLSNDISANVIPNEIPSKTKNKPRRHRLVFLPPTEGEGDILPYKAYIEQQEKAGLSTFTGLTNLEFVRIFSCGLREINWEMFDGLLSLKYLSLEKNNLMFIPDFAFLGVPNLQKLSLAQNQLLGLQSTSLAGLFELEELDLSHNNFSHLSELSLPPFPKLHRADFRYNPIESVFASTFEIMNATSVLYLGGTDSPLSIHPNSFLGLLNLRELNILNVGIAMLERELLRGMPKLKELQLTGTVEGLSFDAFLEVPKLENLVLQKCGIRSISMDAFYGLYGLLYLDLSNNLLESLPPGLFDQQFSLRELLLSNNKLNRLSPGFLANIPAKMIRLDGNPWHCSCAMKDWQPMVINKVKQKGQLSMCQLQYDKGSNCNRTLSANRYIYDKRVAPHCASPPKYKNWSVFQVLRKELRCNKKQHIKMDRKAYLKQKYQDYEKSIQPTVYKYFRKEMPTGNSSHTTRSPKTEKTLVSEATEQNTSTQKPLISTEQNTPTQKSQEEQNTSTQKPQITTKQSTPTQKPQISEEQSSSTQKFQISTEQNTSTQKPQISTSTTEVETSQHDKDISPKIKKDKQKMDLLRDIKDKTSMKPLEANYMVHEENGKQIKLSKKAWKLEMERKRQEKMKKYQMQIASP